MLSKKTILEYVKCGKISIKPHFDEQQLRPLGLRLHLGKEILRPKDQGLIDLSQQDVQSTEYEEQDITQDGLLLMPGDFVLGATAEAIQVDPSMYCVLDGRSTLARLGITIHATAHVIDGNNFEHRTVVLEIKNNGLAAVKLPYLYGIGMLGFGEVFGAIRPEDIQTQYANQHGTVPPNLNFKTNPYTLNEV